MKAAFSKPCIIEQARCAHAVSAVFILLNLLNETRVFDQAALGLFKRFPLCAHTLAMYSSTALVLLAVRFFFSFFNSCHQ